MKIHNPYRKGNQYAHKMQCKMLLCLCAVVMVVCLIGLLQGSDVYGMLFGASGSGVTMASMMTIGNIADVSDRQTHGSNIAYQVYLINVDQIDGTSAFPKKNANREVGQIPMKSGQYMKYFEAHDIPTFNGTGEKGDITTSGENSMVIVMGGMRDALLNFAEEYAGSKFVILFKEVGEAQWYIIGDYDRPMVMSNFDAKNDKDGRYITFTFKRTSIDQYCKYTGAIVAAAPKALAASATTLALTAENDIYTIPGGSTATYAIASISGLTANDKGRYITLEGTATSNAATIADGTAFVLEDGTTWTAKAGSRIVFRVMDASTLVEVPGTRVQIA